MLTKILMLVSGRKRRETGLRVRGKRRTGNLYNNSTQPESSVKHSDTRWAAFLHKQCLKRLSAESASRARLVLMLCLSVPLELYPPTSEQHNQNQGRRNPRTGQSPRTIEMGPLILKYCSLWKLFYANLTLKFNKVYLVMRISCNV